MPSSKRHTPARSRLASLGLGLCALVPLLQLVGCAMQPQQLAYRQRLEAGVQTPEDTLRFKSSPEAQQQIVASAQDWPPVFPQRVDTELMQAVSSGNLGATKAALLAGARVNGSDSVGSTPVLAAAQQGQVDVVRTLLRAGARADGRGGPMTPLAAAALAGHTEVVKLLLANGARPDTSTEAGEPALVQAVRMNRLGAAAALLQAGASLQVRNRQGDSLCMVAIAENYPDMLALLLRHGANPSSPDRDGLTPLYWAGYLQRDALVQQLLAAGANRDVKKISVPTGSSYSLGAFE
jgi:ankyrin repeat protein